MKNSRRITESFSLTLQRRIGLLVLAGLVVGLGLFSLLGIQSLNESTQKVLEERLVLARHMATELDETLTDILGHLQDVNWNNGASIEDNFALSAEPLVNTYTRARIFVRSIILVDASGRVIRVEPKNSAILGTNLSIYSKIREAIETGIPTISDLVSEPLIETPVVFATAPIKDWDGKIAGAVISSIDIAQSTNNSFSPTITIEKTGYVEIVDGSGIVLSRTSPGLPPRGFERSDHPGRFADLISKQEATVGTCHRCHEVNEGIERRQDVLAFAPLSTASWGVAIRQSEEEALAGTRQLERRLILLGAIVLVTSLIMAWSMMQSVVRPLKMLTAAAKKVAAGDFKTAIPVKRKDEIGQLSAAFHAMTTELDKNREELVSRNEELSALNSIATTVSQSLNLKEVVEHALRKVLEVTRTTAGCVFLRDSTGNSLEMVSSVGPSDIFKCRQSGMAIANCACHTVVRHGQTLMVNHVSQCPALNEDAVIEEDIGCFVSIPLKTKNRNLGIMNIACSGERAFTEDDFKILESIGYHVGLAIENSVLFEDAKLKEKLRGEVLNSVINAQEEERKRIARELHDEYGQTLAGLRMNIDSIENMVPPQQTDVNEKLENAKSLIARALEEMRRLTADLRPSVLDDLGLVAAIRAYAHNRLDPLGIQVKFENYGLNRRRLAPAVETALFRIVQEAIHNTTKYAEAHCVRIHLEVRDDKIIALVEDDGKGFDVATALKSGSKTRPLGLLGIQERATLLGGTVNIESAIGRGTRITVEIPITESIEDAGLVLTSQNIAGGQIGRDNTRKKVS
ncbi:MAG: GAF domain-containing protein [Chloroflexi bacterium]|nr:GAF domain-containing protein [Chloroflexota bacterium]